MQCIVYRNLLPRQRHSQPGHGRNACFRPLSGIWLGREKRWISLRSRPQQQGRESFNCYSLILSDFVWLGVVLSEPDAALFLLAAFPGPGLLSLHLRSQPSLCLRERERERERERGDRRGICEMRQVLGCGPSGQSSQSVSRLGLGDGCHSCVSWAGSVTERRCEMSGQQRLTSHIGDWSLVTGHLWLTWHAGQWCGDHTWQGWGEAGGWPRGYCCPLTLCCSGCSVIMQQPRQPPAPAQTAAHNCSTAAAQAGVCSPRCMQSPRSVPCSHSRSNVVTW